MKKLIPVVFSIAILLTVTVVASIDLSQSAEAMQSKGTAIPKYGSATKSKVCGDRLCSEPQIEQKNQKMDSPNQGKMPVMQKTSNKDMMQKHLQQLDEMKSMSKGEILESMKMIMSEHRDMMIQKMSQMERQDLLDHMSMMIERMSMMDAKQMDMKVDGKMTSLYNEMLNPKQIGYPNIMGFNDLHIEAIRHLAPHGDESKLGVIVHHHCKVYDDMTAACLLFPTGMGDQDKPYGMEYIITSKQFTELPDDEKKYWHYHLTELPRAKASFPDLTAEELAPLQPVLDETYGKVFYFWDTQNKYPIGEPTVLVIQDLPE